MPRRSVRYGCKSASRNYGSVAQLNLLIAVHDIAPFHRARLERAETLLERWGIREAMYLLIPNYHGACPANASEPFRQWCLRPRTFNVTWFLHGYYHLRADESCDSAGRLSVAAPRADQLYRADEGEFRSLQAAELHDRLSRGQRVYEDLLGRQPDGFVAPKWQFNRNLVPALKAHGFVWTEGRHAVEHLPTGRAIAAPVITWATRTIWRKYSSLAGTRLLSRLWNNVAWLRIAVHPFDFDHPQTVASIERVLGHALERRIQRKYSDLTAPLAESPHAFPLRTPRDHGRKVSIASIDRR